LSADVNFESLSNVLKNPIRRKIVLTLSERKALTYMELINATEVNNTGKFNYHLKLLGDLIQKDTSDKYILTDKGELAAQFLLKFPKKKAEHKTLRMADAALIGLAGFALTAANPALWIGLWFATSETTVLFPFLLLFPIGAQLYGFLVPGTTMRFLAVKRSQSHDMYDLLRAPLITFGILLVLVILMFLTRFPVSAEIKSPLIILAQGANWSHGSQSIVYVSLVQLFLQGLVFSFLGVILAEGVSRFRKKRTLGR